MSKFRKYPPNAKGLTAAYHALVLIWNMVAEIAGFDFSEEEEKRLAGIRKGAVELNQVEVLTEESFSRLIAFSVALTRDVSEHARHIMASEKYWSDMVTSVSSWCPDRFDLISTIREGAESLQKMKTARADLSAMIAAYQPLVAMIEATVLPAVCAAKERKLEEERQAALKDGMKDLLRLVNEPLAA